MKLCNRWLAALWLGLLGSALSASALAQITTRLTVPGGIATSTKIVAGSPVSFDIRVDATVATIGTAYYLSQGAGASFPFQLIGRSLTGSPYNDPDSIVPDATILAVPSALLAPANASNLGTTFLAGTPAANNILVSTITLSSNPAAPLGVYTVRPDPTNAFISDTSFMDYDMGGSFDITIGQRLSVVLAGSGSGTVTANSGAINCPTVCSDIYPGTTVTLTPTNGTGTFAGWSGACSGTGSCVVTVDAAKSVTATFTLPTFALTVAKAGTGAGTRDQQSRGNQLRSHLYSQLLERNRGHADGDTRPLHRPSPAGAERAAAPAAVSSPWTPPSRSPPPSHCRRSH